VSGSGFREFLPKRNLVLAAGGRYRRGCGGGQYGAQLMRISLRSLGQSTPTLDALVAASPSALADSSNLGPTSGQCPSLEQLQGIVDLSDPCQSAQLGAGTTPAVVTNVSNAMVQAQANQLTGSSTGLYVLAAVAVGIVFMGLVKRH